MKEIGKALTESGIVWWADFETALGIYRHNGMIPWDKDMDIAILAPDHHTAKQTLKSKLDKDKFDVWDFSPQAKAESILKIRIRETNLLIDIYHYDIEAVKEPSSTVETEENKSPKSQVAYEFSHVHEWYGICRSKLSRGKLHILMSQALSSPLKKRTLMASICLCRIILKIIYSPNTQAQKKVLKIL